MGSKFDKTKRVVGAEFRAARWAVRHPHMVLAPGALGAGLLELGTGVTGGIVGGALLAGVGWYRGHPGSFDEIAAPRVRAAHRRWTGPYAGRRWRKLMDAVELDKAHRRTGRVLYPRVVRVQAFTPHVDIVHIELVKGQSTAMFQAKLEQLAETLKVERIAIERTKPGYLALVVQRTEPFTQIIPAPDMPETAEEVDPAALLIGEDELGGEWFESVVGPNAHRLIAGATGAGKNSIPNAMLRGLAPYFREGLAELSVCDPKQLEFAAIKRVCDGRYADDSEGCVEVVERFVYDMERTQKRMQKAGLREAPISREYPLKVLVVDELARLVAFNDGSDARAISTALAKITSMGRTTHHSVQATVIDPAKDVVDIRDLFPSRVCLRVNTPSQPDMVLGADMRERGGVADQIPNVPETAGIGFRVHERSRYPQKVRAAYTTDKDMEEFVAFVMDGRGPGLRSVA